jgi:uncharacterized membrane protein YeaQ/YmgE (transglycosylase-associated protein family)
MPLDSAGTFRNKAHRLRVFARRLADDARTGRNWMSFVVYLIVGGIIGWLASLLMRTDAQQGIILNIVVGVVGAVIAGVLFGRGIGSSSPFDLTGILWSLVGAVILLAVVNLVRRATVR